MATSQDISTLQDLWKRDSSLDEDGGNDIAIGTSGEIVISLYTSVTSVTRRVVYTLNETGSYVESKTVAIYQRERKKGKEIVSILENKIIVSNDSYLRLYSINSSGPFKVKKLEKNPTCIFAHRNALFVTSADSSKVMVYSPELVKESEICLKDIDDQQYPVDLAVTESFIYICTAPSGKAISFERTTGNKLFAFENTQEQISFAISITVNATADLVLVLFKTNRILLFPLNSSRCLIAIDFAAVKIRALQKGQLVAVDKSGVHIFEMKTTVLHKLMRKLKEMKLQQTELERKLSEEQDKRNQYQDSLEKKTKELDELKEKLKEMQLQQTELEGNLDKHDTRLSTTDPKEDSRRDTATDVETIRRGNYDTITSKDSGISSTRTKSSEQDDRRTDTIRSFMTKAQLSTSLYTGNYFNLVVAANIGTDGGELEIPGTKGSINIPPKALRQQEDITIRIVPPETWMEESKSFASNSFSIIELLPNNLKLDKPAKVQIPHCLQIAKRKKPEVEIYISHHEENCQPHWEKSTEHKYKLEDDVCTVYTSSFCWIKVEIDDQIVEAKKIQVFAIVPTITPEDSRSMFTIGYYLDLPGFTNGIEPIEKKHFLFKKEKEQPLSIVLKKTVPKFWNNQPPSSPQEIPFSDIELSKDICCKFPLLKSRHCRGIPLCMFTVSQETREITLSVHRFLLHELHKQNT